MARSKRKQFAGLSGSVMQPIDDLSLLLPIGYSLNSPEFQKALEDRRNRLFKMRVQKMPELARQLGVKVEAFDLSTTEGLMGFYGSLAVMLAMKFGIPGFLEAAPKWDPQIVIFAMQAGDTNKQRGIPNPDLTACLGVVRALDPDLARPGSKSRAMQRAKTLRNRVIKMRQRLARERQQQATAEAKAEAPRKAAQEIERPKAIVIADAGPTVH